MNNCETCQHWKSHREHWNAPDGDPVKPEPRLCMGDIRGVGLVDLGLDLSRMWGECLAPSGPEHIGVSKRMQVWDASSYYAGLVTRQDFGCIEWAERADHA